jgi:Flp pilus assembly protein TadG
MEYGGAMVEFAIVLPLLLLLVFGMIEFSILMYDKAMITNASREGARFAILYDRNPDGTMGKTEAEIKTVIKNYAQAHLISFDAGTFGDANIVVSPRTLVAGDYVRQVTVNYPYTFLVFPNLSKLFGDGIANSLTLSAVTVMRDEHQ